MALKPKSYLVVLASLALLTFAQAQTSTITVVEDEALGTYLADGEGRTLYLTLDDGPDGSGCDEACSRYWPVFTSEDLPEADDAVDTSLISLKELDDGTSQVVYNGWPLYYFMHDREPGVSRGQASADIWYVVSPNGEPIGVAEEEQSEEIAQSEEETTGETTGVDSSELDPEVAAVMEEGEAVYARICVTCHGPAGEGGVGARLIGNPRLSDAHAIADAVTNGTAYMPALGGQMTAEETAAVLTFIRNSWGNEHGLVSVDVAEEVRE